MENILEIKNLNLFIDKFQVLYDVNLNLKKGLMHALVGESGCGKSMTAMSIIRLLPKMAKIETGEIYFKNENILKYKNSKMRERRNKNTYFNYFTKQAQKCSGCLSVSCGVFASQTPDLKQSHLGWNLHPKISSVIFGGAPSIVLSFKFGFLVGSEFRSAIVYG